MSRPVSDGLRPSRNAEHQHLPPKGAYKQPSWMLSDPALHRSLHEHEWRVLGRIRQCASCLAFEEASDE